MNNPTIVIDLDNVLADSAETFVAFSNEHFGTEISLADYNEDWQRMWNVSHEEAERRGEVMRTHQIQRDYRPIAGARETLDSLKDRYRFTILTSRRKESELRTREWLAEYYPGLFDEIVFSGFFEPDKVKGGHLLTKGEQYKQLGAHYVIDDHFKHCESAIAASASGILFGDYSWNQVSNLPEGVVRCCDWAAVAEYFDGIGGS